MTKDNINFSKIFEGILAMAEDRDNYKERKVDKTEINGLEVSTAFTSDLGFETAIIDEDGYYPVERYKTKDEAMLGHKKWCKEAEIIKEIVTLEGWDEVLIPKKSIVLKRKN